MTHPPTADGTAPWGEQPDLPPLPQVTLTSEERAERKRLLVADGLTSAAVVASWFVVAALVGALIWNQVTDVPAFTRVAESGSMGEEELGKQFGISGWFLLIAVVGGLVSGVVLPLLRRATLPALLVVMIAVGGGIATYLMVQVGLVLGPDDPSAGLATAQVGEQVPVQLKPDVDAVYFAWSVAALLGAALVLWLMEKAEVRRALVDPEGEFSPY